MDATEPTRCRLDLAGYPFSSLGRERGLRDGSPTNEEQTTRRHWILRRASSPEKPGHVRDPSQVESPVDATSTIQARLRQAFVAFGVCPSIWNGLPLLYQKTD
ncbi:hypothetical protein RJ55_05089 [Drechmeria coniospora]|nr:hypothetical protein RJ55_05089 [Drechmeria coniospora]